MRSIRKCFLLVSFVSLVTSCCVVFYIFRGRMPVPFNSAGKTSRSENGMSKRVWFDPNHPEENRILAQMEYIPDAYRLALEQGNPPRKKLIMRYMGYPREFYGAPVEPGEKTFQNCPVSRCIMVDDMERIHEMDAIVYEAGHPKRSRNKFPSKQIWAMYKVECPFSSSGMLPGDEMNWTASYRLQSTLQMPSYTFVPNISLTDSMNIKKSYAEGKTKKVAWFVSNCHMVRNHRMAYAKELGKYISVDIYGRCGTLKCGQQGAEECFEMLRKDYKFYLAFENANCRDYITEKFFKNGLVKCSANWNPDPVKWFSKDLYRSDTLPIVMGGHPDDYRKAAPPHSYIHVEDFESPKELAEYLHTLDKNDALYNSYFEWKNTGHYMSSYETKFWCRFCALLHDQDNRPPSWYKDVNKWWRGDGICVRPNSWKENGMYKPPINLRKETKG